MPRIIPIKGLKKYYKKEYERMYAIKPKKKYYKRTWALLPCTATPQVLIDLGIYGYNPLNLLQKKQIPLYSFYHPPEKQDF